MAPTSVTYDAPGWGTGELWLDAGRPAWHAMPVAGRTAVTGDHPLADRLTRYFSGEPVAFDDVPLAAAWPTAFQEALADTLRAVPRGEVVTYGELAALAGRPGAARAAGTFCALNPLPILVPCHRVVAANGIGGYGSLGVEYKRRLLALERNATL